jgi:hypothetical protein
MAVKFVIAGVLLIIVGIGLVQTVMSEHGKPAEFRFNLFAIVVAVSVGLAMVVWGLFYG